MNATQTAVLPHELLWATTTALAPARALHVVAELGVADHIDHEPVPVEELAGRCGVHAGSLDRVLRLLVSIGIFGHEEDTRRYRHSEASRLLREDHPMSMRPFARMIGLPVIWDGFGELATSIRTGAPAIEQVIPGGL